MKIQEFTRPTPFVLHHVYNDKFKRDGEHNKLFSANELYCFVISDIYPLINQQHDAQQSVHTQRHANDKYQCLSLGAYKIIM